MKILIVASYNQNRFVPFITEQAEALQAAGCEIEWFGVQGKGIKGYLKELPRLRKMIREVKPDVIHAHYGLSCLLANLATRRVPVVSTYHGSDINEPKVLPFSKMAMWLSAWNIFVSKRNVDIAKPKKRWSLVPCGVALSEEQLMTRAEARKVLGWKADEKKVLFAGAFDNAVKQPELAKAAIEYLNSKPKTNHPQSLDNDSPSIDPKSAHMQASGQPSAQSCANSLPDDSTKNELLHNSEKNAKNIIELIELKGYTREEVNRLMCAVDCLLMTSKTEGSPQVIKEALACGCPIVSVDVGDVAERTDGVEGCYIVDRGESIVDRLAEALEKALVFKGRTNGRDKIIEFGLTNELVAKQIIKIYESIIK